MRYRHVALIGLGLIASSISHAIRRTGAPVRITGYARIGGDPRRGGAARPRARSSTAPATAVEGADLVILCVPVGAMGAVAAEIAPRLAPGATVSDVGSVKRRGDRRGRRRTCPRACTSSPAIRWPAPSIPGPARASPALRQPLVPADAAAGHRPGGGRGPRRTSGRALGARVDTMEPDHHDLVLAVTSHVPHLIAYTMVGVADHLRRVTEQEVINYSAAGFRDFTRIAASDPTMWRDVFLSNKEATLDILGRFTEELFVLQRAIRMGDGEHAARLLHPHPRASAAASSRPARTPPRRTSGGSRRRAGRRSRGLSAARAAAPGRSGSGRGGRCRP